MDDNVYPTTSQRFIEEPKEQKRRRQKDYEAYLAEKPLIAKTIEHLNTRIEFLHDIDSVSELTDPEKFMRQVAVNKAVAAALTQELRRLELIVKAHGKK